MCFGPIPSRIHPPQRFLFQKRSIFLEGKRLYPQTPFKKTLPELGGFHVVHRKLCDVILLRHPRQHTMHPTPPGTATVRGGGVRRRIFPTPAPQKKPNSSSWDESGELFVFSRYCRF